MVVIPASNIGVCPHYLIKIKDLDEGQINKLEAFARAQQCHCERRWVWQDDLKGHHPWEALVLFILSQNQQIFPIENASQACSVDLKGFDCTQSCGDDLGHREFIGFGLY